MITDTLVEENRIKNEQRRDATLSAVAPKTVKTFAEKLSELTAAVAQVEEERDSTEAAVDQGTGLLLQIGETKQEIEVLQGVQLATVQAPELAEAALSQLLDFHVRGDTFAQARWVNASAEVSRLAAIAPVLPKAIQDAEAKVKALESELREIVKAAEIELPKLLAHLRQVNPRLHAHFAAGRLDMK